jgi:hypothetical protein
MFSFTLVLLVVAAPAARAADNTVTPVQKVIQMLGDMVAKSKAEKAEEVKSFQTYKQFCTDTSREKQYAIETGKGSAEKLQADIEKAGADALQLSKDIAGLDADIVTWSDDKKDATDMRRKEHADFQAVHQDYTESIDAVERALKTLKGTGLSLAQKKASLVRVSQLTLVLQDDALQKKAMQVVTAFLQSAPDNLLLQDAREEEAQPQGTVKNFESQSGSIINMVEELGDKFSDERDQLETDEANKKHSYDMMAQDLTSQIEHGTEERESKAAKKAGREEDKGSYESELADTMATLKSDMKFLQDLNTECQIKSSDFSQRQELRAGEIEALNKAMEVMTGSAVGGGTQHLPSLVQVKKHASLAQLRSDTYSPLQGRVASFLQGRARREHSQLLSLVATKVQADPFKKVTKMIRDMITKLTEEANDEAEHKGFCDAELASNKQTRDSKTEESDTLKATIDQLSADIAKLADQIAELSAGITAIDTAVAKATSIRFEEKEKNTATIADAKAASLATEQATSVLKAFYAQASTATAGYTGQDNTGVLSMLEVIQSDFVRLASETSASEEEGAQSFAQFSADSAADKEAKTTDMKSKDTLKTSKESALATAKHDLKGTTEELEAAVAYYEKLKPSCITQGESYAERVARREEEIESLKEAMKILSGEDM